MDSILVATVVMVEGNGLLLESPLGRIVYQLWNTA